MTQTPTKERRVLSRTSVFLHFLPCTNQALNNCNGEFLIRSKRASLPIFKIREKRNTPKLELFKKIFSIDKRFLIYRNAQMRTQAD